MFCAYFSHFIGNLPSEKGFQDLKSIHPIYKKIFKGVPEATFQYFLIDLLFSLYTMLSVTQPCFSESRRNKYGNNFVNQKKQEGNRSITKYRKIYERMRAQFQFHLLRVCQALIMSSIKPSVSSFSGRITAFLQLLEKSLDILFLEVFSNFDALLFLNSVIKSPETLIFPSYFTRIRYHLFFHKHLNR